VVALAVVVALCGLLWAGRTDAAEPVVAPLRVQMQEDDAEFANGPPCAKTVSSRAVAHALMLVGAAVHVSILNQSTARMRQ
jgi:hypothetical protein